MRGPIDTPQVEARIAGTAIRYNEVLLGDGDLEIRYDGNRSVLTFERAVFADAGGRLALTGTVAFPDSGPGPRFDIAVDAAGYPAQRAIDAVGLDLKIGEGAATGKMVVTGTPENGRATFAGLTIRRADAVLALNGTINWLPGEGNVAFDLDSAATNFPVADIASFLDFGPAVTGDLTRTSISGPQDRSKGMERHVLTARDGSRRACFGRSRSRRAHSRHARAGAVDGRDIRAKEKLLRRALHLHDLFSSITCRASSVEGHPRPARARVLKSPAPALRSAVSCATPRSEAPRRRAHCPRRRRRRCTRIRRPPDREGRDPTSSHRGDAWSART